MGTRAESTRVAMAGPRLAECGTKGEGSLTTSRPCGPAFVHRETKRAGLRVAENGAGRAAPHSRIDKPRRTSESEADRLTQGSSEGK